MKHIRILILCIAFALLTGCAPAAQDTAAYAPDESERLVLYTSHKKEVWWPIVKEFVSRTGIWVEGAAQTNCLSSCKRSRTHHGPT